VRFKKVWKNFQIGSTAIHFCGATQPIRRRLLIPCNTSTQY
jgi:hypothetical protein